MSIRWEKQKDRKKERNNKERKNERKKGKEERKRKKQRKERKKRKKKAKKRKNVEKERVCFKRLAFPWQQLSWGALMLAPRALCPFSGGGTRDVGSVLNAGLALGF